MIASETFVCQTSFQVNCPNDEKNRSRTVTSKHSIDFNDSWSDDNSTNNVETNKRSIFSEEDLYDYDSSTSSDVNKTDNSTNVDNLKNESIQIGTLNVSSNFENGNNSSNLENKSDDSTSDEICHPNVVAICQTKPEIVTVTEQRQLCSNKKRRTNFFKEDSNHRNLFKDDLNQKSFVTTKICITYKDGSWFCKNLVKFFFAKKNQKKN